MEVNYLLGVLFSLIAGVGQGSFMTPMKKMTKWDWENQWVFFSITAYVIFPFLLAFFTMPNLFEIYRVVGFDLVLKQWGLGIVWGVGAVAFGLGTYYLGLALGFAIIMGLSSALGALVPLIFLHPEKIWTTESQAIYVGILIMLIGLVIISKAGSLKEKELAGKEESKTQWGEQRFGLGLFLCIFSGVVSSLINIIFASGGVKIAETALQMGISQSFSQNAFWTAFLPGACVTNLGYAFYLLTKNKTWSKFRLPGTGNHWILGISTGLLWMGGFAFYGSGAANLGELGPSIGWPLMVSSMIIAANIWGASTGEWKGISREPIKFQIIGLVFLLVAILVIGAGPVIFG